MIYGTILRSKIRWYEEGEKNTKFFLSLEKSNAQNKTMSSIINESGMKINNPQKILGEQRAFYEKLHTSNPEVVFDENLVQSKTISEESKNNFEKPLQMEELALALKQTKRFKTPGPDGIPADFYKMFFRQIKITLLEAFNECYNMERIFQSGRRGIISLIPKKGRDLRYIKNWRPIILLCADYKLISKIISNRIRTVLPEIIHKDQAGFVPGRNISENIRKVLDGINLIKQQKIAANLLLIDFEKAFDHVEYRSLCQVFYYFNFGTNLVKWITILFTDFSLCTTSNGYSSNYFAPTRGLFQGNPISSTGFIIMIELLAIAIRTNPQIHLVVLDDIKLLLSLFADYLSIFLPDNICSWNALKSTISKFECSSGLKVNYDKTIVYRIGSVRCTQAMYYALRKLIWSEGKCELLGIKINEDQNKMFHENWAPAFKKAKTLCDIWKMRGLSLIGGITVFNSLVASLFFYKLAVCRILPENYLKQIEHLERDFVWQGKKPKIALKTLQGIKEDGGLALCDFKNRDLSFKIQWVFKLENNSELRALADADMQKSLR